MKNKIILPIIFIVIGLLLILIFVNDIFVREKDNIMLIGYSKYSTQWIDIKNGAMSAGEKYGFNVSAIACDSKQDTIDQIALIEEALLQDVDVIMLMPTNLTSLSTVIEKAERSKVKLVILDENVAKSQYDYVGTSLKKMGKDIYQDIINRNNEQVNVGCIYTYDDGGKSATAYNSFVESAKPDERITIVSESMCAIDTNLAGAIAQSILSKNNANYIICFDETITEGVASKLKSLLEDNKDDTNLYKTKVIGVGYINNCAMYLEDNIMTSLIVQNYYGIGYMAVYQHYLSQTEDVYVDHHIIHKEEMDDVTFQQILFGVN